jgi:thioredoxin reductase
MSNHTFDVIVIGGSYAGMAAALPLVRARKSVLVIDAGERRNRFATAAHNLPGQDGRSPDAIARDARADVAKYPSATFVHGMAISAAATINGFAVALADGSQFRGSRLVLATGVTDEFPDLPGLREGWGNWIFHCPYCHGYEVAGKRLGVLALNDKALHQAMLIPEWGPTTFFTNGLVDVTPELRSALSDRSVTLEETPVVGLVDDPDRGRGALLEDGRLIAIDALFTFLPIRQTSSLAEQLGCAIDDTPMGPVIRVDGTGQTTVPGVYAGGDASQPMKSLAAAIASGQIAGTRAHQSLLPTFT